VRNPRYKISAVLFDLGDTLLNFGRIDTTHLFRQGARLSYDFLKQQRQPVGSFRWYFWVNLLRIRFRYWLSNLTGRDFDTLELLKKVGTQKGIKLDQRQWQHLAWLWYEPLSKIASIEPKLKDTLNALKNLGLKLGIVSNTFVNRSSLEKHLSQLNILNFFTVRLYSYEFSLRKPDPEMFKVAAERIGEAVNNILYVGDRVDKDIEPAVRSGMYAALKVAHTNVGKKLPEGAWKITSLAELPALIEKINAEVACSV
jgi:putative hydrolase of the HAD superfamily